MRIALVAAAVVMAGAVVAQPAGQQGMGGMGGGMGHGSGHGMGNPQGSPDFKLPPDPRTALEVPPHVREFLRFEMRGHLAQLNELMARVAEGNFKEAANFAKSGLAVMGNHPPGAPSPGAFMPPEFRAMGQAMHKAADAVAKAAGDAASPPNAQDWKNVAEAMGNLTGACAGCHGSFRLK